jgi:hypothetical protein
MSVYDIHVRNVMDSSPEVNGFILRNNHEVDIIYEVCPEAGFSLCLGLLLRNYSQIYCVQMDNIGEGWRSVIIFVD